MSLDILCEDILYTIGSFCKSNLKNLRLSSKTGLILAQKKWNLYILYKNIQKYYSDRFLMEKIGLIKYTKTMTQTSLVYNPETQIFDSLLKLTKTFRVRKRLRESFNYYKPLHLKEINQNEINETARVFINNTDLPMSSEKENPNAFEYCLNRPKPIRNDTN